MSRKSVFPTVLNNSTNSVPNGFGQKTRQEAINFNDKFFEHRIYKKLYQPECMVPSEKADNLRYDYKHYDLENINKQVSMRF
jgi:hypothetical protein